MKSELDLAPPEIFDQILEYMVIPTFDLVIRYGNQGIILVKRRIPPYKNTWALPGLRMLKVEGIDDTLRRIAKQEIGLTIDPTERVFLGQFVDKFKTEHKRQDLSTGYLFHVSEKQPILLNREHFSEVRVSHTIPKNIGAMYRFYLANAAKLSNDSND